MPPPLAPHFGKYQTAQIKVNSSYVSVYPPPYLVSCVILVKERPGGPPPSPQVEFGNDFPLLLGFSQYLL